MQRKMHDYIDVTWIRLSRMSGYAVHAHKIVIKRKQKTNLVFELQMQCIRASLCACELLPRLSYTMTLSRLDLVTHRFLARRRLPQS